MDPGLQPKNADAQVRKEKRRAEEWSLLDHCSSLSTGFLAFAPALPPPYFPVAAICSQHISQSDSAEQEISCVLLLCSKPFNSSHLTWSKN